MLSTVVIVQTGEDVEAAFTTFVQTAEPRLRRAFTVNRGRDDGREALAEALGWAWEHWSELEGMENPVGYLYRVGCSRTRARKRPPLQPVPLADGPRFEPGLDPALRSLPDKQRTVVILIHGCGWTHHEVAEALGVSRSSVATHLRRAMKHLRNELGVDDDA